MSWLSLGFLKAVGGGGVALGASVFLAGLVSDLGHLRIWLETTGLTLVVIGGLVALRGWEVLRWPPVAEDRPSPAVVPWRDMSEQAFEAKNDQLG